MMMMPIGAAAAVGVRVDAVDANDERMMAVEVDELQAEVSLPGEGGAAMFTLSATESITLTLRALITYASLTAYWRLFVQLQYIVSTQQQHVCQLYTHII